MTSPHSSVHSSSLRGKCYRCVTFAHKGKQPAGGGASQNQSGTLHLHLNQELFVTATVLAAGCAVINETQIGSRPCVLLKCPWVSFWIPNSCENAVLWLTFDLWLLSAEKQGRVFFFLCNQTVTDCFCHFERWYFCSSFKVRRRMQIRDTAWMKVHAGDLEKCSKVKLRCNPSRSADLSTIQSVQLFLSWTACSRQDAHLEPGLKTQREHKDTQSEAGTKQTDSRETHRTGSGTTKEDTQ